MRNDDQECYVMMTKKIRERNGDQEKLRNEKN